MATYLPSLTARCCSEGRKKVLTRKGAFSRCFPIQLDVFTGPVPTLVKGVPCFSHVSYAQLSAAKLAKSSSKNIQVCRLASIRVDRLLDGLICPLAVKSKPSMCRCTFLSQRYVVGGRVGGQAASRRRRPQAQGILGACVVTQIIQILP